MNSRERVLTTIAHKEPDRVPLFFNAIEAKFVRAISRGDMIQTWKQLGVDVFVIARRSWCEGKPTGLGYSPEPPPPEDSLGGAIYAGWNGVDEFGRRWKHGRYVGGAVSTREDLQRYSPELKLEERYSRPMMADWKKNHSDRAVALFSHSGPLGLTIEAFGLIDFCYALFDKRALIQESAELKTQWFIETAKRAVELGVDFVVMGDDMGFKGHGYVSPADFKELAFPYYRRIVDSLSVPVFWHSEGYIRDYIPTAIEAGIKGLHAIEAEAGMNMGEIKKEFGKDLVLLGNVDGNHILCQPDLELVRREVDRCLQEGMKGGGYMLSIAGSAHEGIHLEAMMEMCRYLQQVGVYPNAA
ncbi:MAG: uroporphyrinogen decarboxylase family protein [Thermodesulfobacteriota bacterium]